MKVVVVYSDRCKETKLLAQDMARYARTYARPLSSFDFDEDIDLLVVGFEENYCFKDKQLHAFLKQLSRQHIKNIALFNMFCLSNKQMDNTIKLCQDLMLPLMRETYSCKKGLRSKPFICDDILSGGRVYIEDMVNICRHYY